MSSKISDSDKQTIILRYLSGEKISNLVQETGIPRSTLYSWIKVHKELNSKKQPKLTVRAFKDLENKVERLEGIIEILKTVDCKPNSPLREKLYALEELYDMGLISIRRKLKNFMIKSSIVIKIT